MSTWEENVDRRISGEYRPELTKESQQGTEDVIKVNNCCSIISLIFQFPITIL